MGSWVLARKFENKQGRPRALAQHRQVSVRGAIRQAPSVITWCQVLMNLKTWGVQDPNIIIREWNEENPASERITGGKAHAVRLILNSMPNDIFALTCSHGLNGPTPE